MRILLIGGSGFIGPHVAVDLIRDGHDVTVFHRGSARSEVAQAFRPAIAGLTASAKASAVKNPCATIVGDRARLADFADDLRALAQPKSSSM